MYNLYSLALLDYVNASIELQFEAFFSTQSQCFNIATITDSIIEPVEKFSVSVVETTNPRVEIGVPASAVVEIVDNTGENTHTHTHTHTNLIP